VIRTKTAHFST